MQLVDREINYTARSRDAGAMIDRETRKTIKNRTRRKTRRVKKKGNIFQIARTHRNVTYAFIPYRQDPPEL